MVTQGVIPAVGSGNKHDQGSLRAIKLYVWFYNEGHIMKKSSAPLYVTAMLRAVKVIDHHFAAVIKNGQLANVVDLKSKDDVDLILDHLKTSDVLTYINPPQDIWHD